jgi:hypothetical protein
MPKIEFLNIKILRFFRQILFPLKKGFFFCLCENFNITVPKQSSVPYSLQNRTFIYKITSSILAISQYSTGYITGKKCFFFFFSASVLHLVMPSEQARVFSLGTPI